jgi:hypothetical protein
MSPELTGFVLGLLLGAAKLMAITTVGFGIAWWRARRRVQELEGELQEDALPPNVEERLRQVEEVLARVASRLEVISESQALLSERLPQASDITHGPLRSGERHIGTT